MWAPNYYTLLETVPGSQVLCSGQDAGVTLYENLDARGVAHHLPSGQPLTSERLAHGHWRVQAEGRPGTVVLTQAWYPGWVAEVDGEPVDVGLSEGLYLAVEVPPGAGEVELRFDNPWVFLGQRLGLVAWLLWGLALAWLAQRRR